MTPGSTAPSVSNGDKSTIRTSSSTTSTWSTWPPKRPRRPPRARVMTCLCFSPRPPPTRNRPSIWALSTRKSRNATARRSISPTNPLTIQRPSAISLFPILTSRIPATGTRIGGPTRVSRMAPIPGRSCAPAPKKSATRPAMRALLWSFGGAEQDESGNVTINSKETIEALKFMKALYQESETPEVFTWTPPSNNQAMLAGRVSYVANAISISRQAEREHLPIDSKIMVSRALKGPVRRIAAEHVMDCYVVWDFAENKEGAQQFLIDFIDAFHDSFIAGQFYNFPCFPSTVPDLQKEISNDPRATPPDKYKVLGDVLDWATNVGYPGYGSAAIDEAFKAWVIPTMFAKVARGDETPENAAKAAEDEYKRIFARWK